jgi:hypothetical protein
LGDACNDGVCVESSDICEAQPKVDGTTCDDGEYCTVGDQCSSGNCESGGSRHCNDDDPCTDDSCNEGQNQCDNVLVPKPGLEGPYGDNTCNNQMDDDCDQLTDENDPNCMQCTVPADCDDGDPCTADDCVSNNCLNDPQAANGTICDDGLYCTDGDECLAGVCGGTTRDCSDGVTCTDDTCNENLDTCESVPNDGLCDDQNPDTTDTCDPVQDCQNVTCALNPDSVVTASSTCLVRDSFARATIFVDLRDTGGQPVIGAEVTFGTTGEPVTWVEGAVTESISLPGTYYRTLIAPLTGAGTTVSVDAACVGSSLTLNQTATVTYADPNTGDGGTAGCSPADGNLRVKVIEAETGNPIENANVMVGLTDGTPFTTSAEDYLAGNVPSGSNLATTDALGYAYFYDLGTALDGNLTVTAGQPNGAPSDRAYFTFERLQASDVIIPLRRSSPAGNSVRFSGGTVSDFSLTPVLSDIQEALVLPEVSLDDVTAIGADNLLAKNRCVTFPGPSEEPVPGNRYLPTQEVVMAGIYVNEALWELSFPQNRRLNAIFYSLPMDTMTSSCAVSEFFANIEISPYATYFGETGFVPTPNTSTDTADYDIPLDFAYPRLLTLTASARPAQTDLLGIVLGDYAGSDGTGPGYINGLSLVRYDAADPDTTDVPFASDGSGGNVPTNPDPGNARYYMAAVALYFDPVTARPAVDRPDITAENGTSAVLWRDDGSGDPPFSGASDVTAIVDSFLEIAKLKIDTSHKTFIWDDLAFNGTNPHLSVHHMYRVTKKYRDVPLPCMQEPDVISTTRDLYWEVWRPYDVNCSDTTGSEITPNPKECFTLPTLPAAWPRAGVDTATGKDDGFAARQGSGTECVNDPDCAITGDSCVYFGDRCNDQRHRSCTTNADCEDCRLGDTCTATWQICLANDGSNDFVQQNEWHLRVSYLGPSTAFDFNNFALADRLTHLTHESTNRLVLE